MYDLHYAHGICVKNSKKLQFYIIITVLIGKNNQATFAVWYVEYIIFE